MIVNLDNMHRTCTFVPHPVFKLELVSSKLLSFISSVHLVTKKDMYYCLFCVLWIEDYALMFLWGNFLALVSQFLIFIFFITTLSPFLVFLFFKLSLLIAMLLSLYLSLFTCFSSSALPFPVIIFVYFETTEELSEWIEKTTCIFQILLMIEVAWSSLNIKRPVPWHCLFTCGTCLLAPSPFASSASFSSLCTILSWWLQTTGWPCGP